MVQKQAALIAIGIAVVVALAAFLLARPATQEIATPAVTPTPSAATPSAGTPSAAAPSTGTPSLQAVPGFPGVETSPLGNVRGEYVFATRDVQTSSVAFGELWAIPLANGAGALSLVRYPGFASSFLSSRLSPDGTRYAFPVDRGDGKRRIVIVNLADGSMRWLRTDDTSASDAEPAWDPSGTRVAFVRSEAGPEAQESLWVVSADGSGLKRLVPPAAAPVFVHQWTPDGRQVAFHRDVGYDVVDVATGVRVHMDNVLSADASWRSRPPALLAHGLASEVGSDQQSIFTADAPAGARNVLVRGTSINNPRWRPGADEFLYAFFDYRTSRADLRVRSLSGGERVLPISAGSPTW